MRLIDTHCHLAHGRLRQETQAVLERAKAAGVVAVICAGADVHESKTAYGLAARFPQVYFTAGVHPHDAVNAGSEELKQIQALAGSEKCVAVGEIGLDYHYNFSPPKVQRKVFAQQLDLAKELTGAIVIHTREAFDDTVSILNESGVDGSRVIFHSFTEGPINARRAIDMGAMISFAGIVTFNRAAELRESAMTVPDDRILIETDSPFLTPEPVRKMKANEPANVAHVASCLAKVRGTSQEEIAELTTQNAVRFFGLEIE